MKMLRWLFVIVAFVVVCNANPARAQDEGWTRRLLHLDRIEKWREQRKARAAYAARREAIRRAADSAPGAVPVAAAHPATRVYSYIQREPDARRRGECLVPRSVVGLEKYSLEEAKNNAIAMWMEAEKLHNGVKYMNPENAVVLSNGGKGPDCYISSTGNRASERLAEGAGKVLHQCEFRARPCSGIITEEARR